VTRASSDALHVVHVTSPAQFGGLESVVEALSSGLVGLGLRSTVICVLDREQADHPLVTALTAGGSQVVPVVLGSRHYLKELRVLERLLRDLDADVVHTHGYRSDVIGGLAARQAGRSTVSTLHGFAGQSWKGAVSEWIQVRSLRRFDAVVTVSPGIADRVRLSGVQEDRVHVIPNAWGGGPALLDRAAARAELGISPEAFVVGWIGRLSREKGADVFLEALARWRPAGVIASIIGDGRERHALEHRAAILGVDRLVRWHGARREAGRLMRAFDALALSSRTEGVPMVVLEAMHAGTPLIVTAVGGIPTVLDATQAILVKSEAPDELAAGFERLRADPTGAQRRSERAAAHLAGAFAVRPWLERYLMVYAISRSSRGSAKA
jgi:glycosyltransferase involved in cell wall biosynthesis